MEYFTNMEDVKKLVIQLNKLGQQILVFDDECKLYCGTDAVNSLMGPQHVHFHDKIYSKTTLGSNQPRGAEAPLQILYFLIAEIIHHETHKIPE